MSAFSLDKENELRRKEDYFFVDLEIEYGLSLCKSYIKSGIEKSFYLYLQKRFELLKEALEIIQAKHRDNLNLRNKQTTDTELLDESFVIFSDVLEDITSTMTQRRLKEPMILRGRPISTPRFLLSEVHLDYGDTFRCIETINNCCWKALANFFDNINYSYVPLIVVSRGHGYGVEFFPSSNRKTEFCDPTNKNKKERENFLKYFILLSRITGPRAFPMHIRSAPLLAHEQFHIVLNIVQKAIADCGDEGPLRDQILDKTSYEYISNLYGKYYKLLVGDYIKLRNSLFEMLTEHIKEINDLIKEISGNESEELNLRLDIKAEKHAKEFLADIAGLMIAGPSFIFSFISEILRNRATWIETEHSYRYHPPSCVRAKVLLLALEYLGFENLHKTCGHLINDYLFNFHPYYKKIHSFYLKNFLEPNSTLLTQCIKDLRHLIKLQASEAKYYHKREESPLGVVVKEDDWKNEMKEIIQRVLNNQIYYEVNNGIRSSAIDILNAIWLKIISPEYEGTPHKGLVWRLILSKGGSNHAGERKRV